MWRRSIWGTESDSVFGAALALVERDSGETRWQVDSPRTVTRTAADEHQVAASGSRSVHVYDLRSGEKLWGSDDSQIGGQVVFGPERLYALGRNCEVVALSPEGTRWTRTLDTRDCSVVEGWIDGETVAVLFESGEIVRLQRIDQSPGLLW